MLRTNKLLVLLVLLAFVLLPFAALAEELPAQLIAMLPEGGEVESCTELGGMRFYAVSISETGEELIFSCDGQGTVLSIQTQKEAEFDPSAAPMERARAEELIKQAYPGCRILFAQTQGALRKVGVAADGFCGTVVLAEDKICSRSLEMGEIYRDGMLTMEGALRVLCLHRPEAQFRALELDEDDGVYVYEGEAMIGNVEYEFELSVSSGRLLEWERD